MNKADSTPTLASSIAAMLRERIAHGDFAPGAKLRLDELRSMFGVSLSPLREALSRLCAEGFVATEDQRGYRVVPVSQNNLDEVIRLRVQFESYALREAIKNGDDVWEGEVLAALHRLNKIERGRVDAQGVSQWEQFHSVFHRRLISACGMPLLLHFCETLHDLNDRYRRIFLSDNPVDRDVRQEHVDICTATLERRADEACDLLRSHVERTGANVLKALGDGRASTPAL
ncbi:GntR family transcriptional regulator [Pusillimonas sp.]|uniref:GntR family transcriptional regulator n=1 Tax=Pusillimonas sp. TaxID=3040095 RepID=UPI0029A3E8F8|nr:GntR family transcriptional regulator [Pusillimonas sp.]MDX3893194.1 GntR family transcriptional regulator [Pusillimonas sp.]